MELLRDIERNFRDDTGPVTIRTPVGRFTIWLLCGDVRWTSWDTLPFRKRPTQFSDASKRIISELRQYFKTGWSDFGWFEIPKFALLLKPEEVVRAFVFLKDNVRPGQLITYNELADIVGAEPPVLRAHIQNNRLPVIIPCHRVIRSDGRMGGYQRGHDDKKYWLLKLEGIRFKGDIW